MPVAEVSIHTPIAPEQMEAQTKALCDSVSKHRPEDTQALFGDLHKMATLYYRGALAQASRSFFVAEVFAGAGTLLIMFAVGLWMLDHHDWSEISALSGLIVQVISGLNFYLYRKATAQFELFHICLERMGRYLMANSVCENIKNDQLRDETRNQLVGIMANASMLPAECLRNLREEVPRSSTSAPVNHATSPAAP